MDRLAVRLLPGTLSTTKRAFGSYDLNIYVSGTQKATEILRFFTNAGGDES